MGEGQELGRGALAWRKSPHPLPAATGGSSGQAVRVQGGRLEQTDLRSHLMITARDESHTRRCLPRNLSEAQREEGGSSKVTQGVKSGCNTQSSLQLQSPHT